MEEIECDGINEYHIVRIDPTSKRVQVIETEDEFVEEDDKTIVQDTFLGDKRSVWWSEDEMKEFFRIMKDKNIVSLFNGRQYRRADVFKVVADNLRRKGFARTPEQVRIKWKNLRASYFRTKAKYSSNNERNDEFAFYDEVDELVKLYDSDDNIIDEIDGVKLVRINQVQRKRKILNPEDFEFDELDDVPFKVEQKFLKDKRAAWSDGEMRQFFKIMKERGIMSLLSGRQYRRSDIFQVVSDDMKKRGFLRTPDQVQIKWKNLKASYFRAKSKYSQSIDRKNEFPYYDEVDDIISGRGQAESYIGIEQIHELLNRLPSHSLAQMDGSKFFEANIDQVKVPSREEIYQARESSITYALENFTKNWQAMVLRVAEKEMEQDKKDKEREQRELRIWEERLIEKQCAAMSKTNQEFLAGLRDIFEGLKK